MNDLEEMSKPLSRILQSRFDKVDTGFSVSARCTNAAAFVHKTPAKSGFESLGTRLSEMLQNSNSNSMTRRKVDPSVRTTHKVTIHLSQAYFEKLQRWKAHSNCRSVSELARSILYKEQINWYHKDASLESTAIELAGIRKELNAIGKNINQITHHFHSAGNSHQKVFQALKVADQCKKVGVKVDELLKIVSEISKTWLRK